jgi:hypothetical protein
MTFDPPGAPERVPQMDFLLGPKMISPDGEWIAYQSGEPGGEQIFVRPFKGRKESQSQHHVVTRGWGPRWSRDGRSLFFRRDHEIWGVPVRSGADNNDFQAGTPELLIRHDLLTSLSPDVVEPTLDGMRFLVIRRPARERKERVLVYVPNWLDEVKAAFK